MEGLQLTELELQIETLMHAHQQMRQENASLRKKLAQLTQERAVLLSKNKNTVGLLKNLITQLRKEFA